MLEHKISSLNQRMLRKEILMFGLAFLNLVGTVLFIGMMLMLFKGFSRKMRYAKNSGHWDSWQPSHHWHEHRQYQHHQDEAMKHARERLANSELSPEDFVAIKNSLEQSKPQSKPSYPRDDAAITTLRLRLAKGEISPEDFEAVRQALQ
jgi:uncharacterized membrane protein